MDKVTSIMNRHKINSTNNETRNHDAETVAPKTYRNENAAELNVVGEGNVSQPLKLTQKQNGRRDVTAGFRFLQKDEAQRNIMTVVEDRLKKLSFGSEQFKVLGESIREANARPLLARMNAMRQVMNGYRFPERQHGKLSLISDINNSRGDDDDSSFASGCSTSSDDYASFEAFVVRAIAQQRNQYRNGIRNHDNTLIFSCSDHIMEDYTRICEHYEKLKQQPSIQNACVPITEKSNGQIDDSVTAIDYVEIHLYAASKVFQQFLNVTYLLQKADRLFTNLSEDNKLKKSSLHVVYGNLESYLLAQLSLLVVDMNKITPRQAAQLLCWCDAFLMQIETNDITRTLNPSSAWKTERNMLLDRYTQCGVRDVLHILLERVDHDLYTGYHLGVDKDLRQTREGMLVTSLPEEVIYVIDLQIQVAADYLGKLEYIIHVFQVCYDEISILVCNKMSQIESYWRTNSITIERFCAIINDSVRLSDLLEQFTTKFLSKYNKLNEITNESRQTILKEATRVGDKLADLSMHAMNHLCRYIVYQLEYSEELSLCHVGLLSWELDDECTVTQHAVSYLRERFDDIGVWLQSSEYFFPKIVQKCLQLTIHRYVASFFNSTMQHGIQNSVTVSRNLKRDYDHLATFFNTSPLFACDDTRQTGLLSNQDINAQLMIILSLSRLIDPTIAVADLSDDTRYVLESVQVVASCTPSNGTIDNATWSRRCNSAAVLHIAGLEKHGKSSSCVWINNLVSAERAIQARKRMMTNDLALQNRSSPSPMNELVQLPDLLYSPYVYKIRFTDAVANDIMKSCSSEPFMMAYVEALKDLLGPKKYTKQCQMFIVQKASLVSPLKPTIGNKAINDANDENFLNKSTGTIKHGFRGTFLRF